MKRNLMLWLALGLVAWIAYDKFLKPANASGKVPTAGPVRLPSGVQPVVFDPNAIAPPNVHITDPDTSVVDVLASGDFTY